MFHNIHGNPCYYNLWIPVQSRYQVFKVWALLISNSSHQSKDCSIIALCLDNQWRIVEEVKTEGEPDVDGIMVNTEPLVEGDKRVGERQELVLEEAYPYHAGKYRCRGYNKKDSIVVETEVVTSGNFDIIVFVALNFVFFILFQIIFLVFFL